MCQGRLAGRLSPSPSVFRLSLVYVLNGEAPKKVYTISQFAANNNKAGGISLRMEDDQLKLHYIK